MYTTELSLFDTLVHDSIIEFRLVIYNLLHSLGLRDADLRSISYFVARICNECTTIFTTRLGVAYMPQLDESFFLASED